VVRYFQVASGSAAGDLYWGVAQVEQHSSLQGLQSFQAAMDSQQPRFAEPWVELALARMENLELEAAKQAFSRALGIDPEVVLARYNLGRACRFLGQMEEAAAHYRLVLAMDERRTEAQNNHGKVGGAQGDLDWRSAISEKR
jgi:Tfp pilus assembly protein PilF